MIKLDSEKMDEKLKVMIEFIKSVEEKEGDNQNVKDYRSDKQS